MKTGYGSAGDTDKHHREYRRRLRICTAVVNSFGKAVWYRMSTEEKHEKQPRRHKKQCESEQRIEIAYKLVDRQKRSKYIVEEYRSYPERPVKVIGSHARKKICRIYNKNSAHKNKENNRYDAHRLFDRRSEFAAYDFG